MSNLKDQSNVLEYYIDTYLIKSLSKSKENKIKLNQSYTKKNAKILQEMTLKRGRQKIKTLVIDGTDENSDNEDYTIDDHSVFTSTTVVTSTLIKFFEEGDITNDIFDNAYWISKQLECLGRLTNFDSMMKIVAILERQMLLVQ